MKYHLAHNIGPSPDPRAHIRANYHTREQIESCDGIVTYDGIYRNVYENRDILKGNEIFFVMGNYVGGDNSFDDGMPYERYCTWEEIRALGGEIGWHTKSHRDLTTLSDEELEDEIKPPFPMDSFAYPYGRYNGRVIEVVKKYYKQAFSVFDTDGTNWTIPRPYVR